MTSPGALKPGTRSFIRLSVRRKVDLPEPVGPMSAVIDPRFSVTLMSARTVRPENPRFSLADCMTCTGSGRVRVEGLQGLVDIGLCSLVVTGSLRVSIALSVSHYQERSDAR